MRSLYLRVLAHLEAEGEPEEASARLRRDALEALGQVSGWVVADRERIRAGSAHSVFLRMRLDTTQLPRPLQLTVVTTRDWTLASEWRRFNVDAAGVPAPAPAQGATK